MRHIHREIFSLAVPAIVSNITTPLLGLVDTAITGHMGGAAYVGAIAVGAGMFSLAYWPMAFLRMGTSGLTAQAYGAKADLSVTLYRAGAVAALVSLLLIILSPLICAGLLKFMDADPSTTALARTYFLTVIFGAPAVLGNYVLSGWFLGIQNSKAPMWMALVTNVVNIIVSPALVYFAGMKIEGVAIGTLAAQWAGLLSGMAILLVKSRSALSKLNIKEIFDATQLKRFFSVNGDIFLRTLCLAAVTLWFAHAGAVRGADALAANALLMQLFILFSYFMDGFAFAGEAMAGKYCGAGDRRMLRSTVKAVFTWSWAMAGAFTAVYGVSGKEILALLTDDPTIIRTAMRYLPWAIAVPFAGVAAFAWDGIFIGCTLTRQMLQSMLAAMTLFFVTYYVVEPHMGNHGLWLAFIAYLAARGGVQTILWKNLNNTLIGPFGKIKVEN